MKKLIQKASKFKVEESDDSTMTIKAYGSVFGNLDSDNDVIHKGAFKRTISSWGPEGADRIKLVAQHDLSRPIAKITAMKEDDKGLYIEAKFGEWTDSKDYYAMMKSGVINELSVGFVPIQKEENDKGGFDITEIKLFEISAVTIAANEEAVITDVKAADPLKLIKKIKDEDLAFQLEHEILKLMSKTQEDTTPPATEVALDSVVEKQDSITNQLNKLYGN